MAVLGTPIDLPKFDWNAARGQSEHEKAFDKLQAESDALGQRGEVKGRLIRFQVADGYAFYRIEKLRPLTLAHIDWLDGYQASPILIRGLRVDDVKDMLASGDRIRALFGAKK